MREVSTPVYMFSFVALSNYSARLQDAVSLEIASCQGTVPCVFLG